jgi:hypothetical protein
MNERGLVPRANGDFPTPFHSFNRVGNASCSETGSHMAATRGALPTRLNEAVSATYGLLRVDPQHDILRLETDFGG